MRIIISIALNLFLLCKAKGAAHFLPINTDSKTVVEAAEEYEKEVRNVLKACKSLVLI